jgi:uncharacterized membrane protein YccC
MRRAARIGLVTGAACCLVVGIALRNGWWFVATMVAVWVGSWIRPGGRP